MQKKEADFGLLLRHWLKANPRFSCAYELKQTKFKSIPFGCVEEHQIDWLVAIKGPKGVLIRHQGGSGEPDYVYLRNFPACVGIKYPSGFALIDIDTFLLEKKRTKERGLTWARAQEISTISVQTAKKRP